MKSSLGNSFYCIDKETGERCWVNSTAPQRISKDFIEGDLMFLVRDDEHSYFEGMKRRFDVQFQFQLKQETQTVWYGVELDETLELSYMQNMIATGSLGFCKRMNPGSFYSRLSREPCMVFKVEHSMDRIARTEPGDSPPCLGEPIHETAKSIKKRAKHGMDWNTRDTFTISCFSAYFDFLSWSCINIPFMPNFDVTKVVGEQPFRLTAYVLKDENGEHIAANKTYIYNMEISNTTKTRLGSAAREWIEKNAEKVKEDDDTSLTERSLGSSFSETDEN